MILIVPSHTLGPGVESLYRKPKNRRMAEYVERHWGTERASGREWPSTDTYHYLYKY